MDDVARRTKEQRDAVAAFVNRLASISGAETNVDFANAAGLWESNVSEYRSGKAVPDGYNLILMIRAVLGDELEVLDAVADRAVPPARRVPRRDLEGAVAELLEWQPSVATDLLDIRTRLELLESELASPRTNDSRR